MSISTELTGPAIRPAAPAVPSPQFRAWLARRRRSRYLILALRVSLLLAFLLLWEAAPRLQWVNPMLTSYPTAVWRGFAQLIAEGHLGMHISVTLIEVAISFFIAMAGGTAVAVGLWAWPVAQRVLDPFLVVANALPKIALVPIFYIWLGPEGSIYAVAISVAIFITILMLYTGFQQTDPNKLKLARTFGATRIQLLQKVVLPGNVNSFVAALKANAGLALVGVIVGEFQASKAGLGYLIIYDSQIFRMDMVMAAIVILGLISLVIYGLIEWLSARLSGARA